jgi:hypothetical protein
MTQPSESFDRPSNADPDPNTKEAAASNTTPF